MTRLGPDPDEPPALRFLVCGSVDDGKSTLIGRLLEAVGAVREDESAALDADSSRRGSTRDVSLLLDGLESEREQGITVDVAYRHFRAGGRAFVAVDCPGHVQYVRNMATGASDADLAVIIVDVRAGVSEQTMRHAAIAALMGIERVVLAVNKMDAVGFGREAFERARDDFAARSSGLGFARVDAVPVSALLGDNVAAPGARTPWYGGMSLLGLVASHVVVGRAYEAPFRLPVQFVVRDASGIRGYAGTLASGRVRPGDVVAVARNGVRARVARLTSPEGDSTFAQAGDAAMLVLTDDVELGRGDVLSCPDAPPTLGYRLDARMVWLDDAPSRPDGAYLLLMATRVVPVASLVVASRLDLATMADSAVDALDPNDVGRALVTLAEPVAYDPFRAVAATGRFVLVDRDTDRTVAAGVVDGPVAADGDGPERDDHGPVVVWFTGLSGAGKTTLADAVGRRLAAAGVHAARLDGDRVRRRLCADLGFSRPDRAENLRRVASLARGMADAGLVVLCSFVSPFEADRSAVREAMGDVPFLLVHVATPLATCAARDPKGLYAGAAAGSVAGLTGVGQAYEKPTDADVVTGIEGAGVAAGVRAVLEALAPFGVRA